MLPYNELPEQVEAYFHLEDRRHHTEKLAFRTLHGQWHGCIGELGLPDPEPYTDQIIAKYYRFSLPIPFAAELAVLKEMAENAKNLARDVLREHAHFCKGKLQATTSVCDDAFRILGWKEGCDAPKEWLCDEQGCVEPITGGASTESGYRNLCSKHLRAHYADFKL